MERTDATERLAARIFAAEEALDDVLSRAAGLVGELVDARRDVRLSTTVCHDLFEGLGGVSAHLTQARGALVQVHKRLDVFRRHLGLPAALVPVDKDLVPNEAVPVERIADRSDRAIAWAG